MGRMQLEEEEVPNRVEKRNSPTDSTATSKVSFGGDPSSAPWGLTNWTHPGKQTKNGLAPAGTVPPRCLKKPKVPWFLLTIHQNHHRLVIQLSHLDEATAGRLCGQTDSSFRTVAWY